jgi:hypothetical protein
MQLEIHTRHQKVVDQLDFSSSIYYFCHISLPFWD